MCKFSSYVIFFHCAIAFNWCTLQPEWGRENFICLKIASLLHMAPCSERSFYLWHVKQYANTCCFEACLSMSIDQVCGLVCWIWMFPFCSSQHFLLGLTIWCTSSFMGHCFSLLHSFLFSFIFYYFSFLHIILPWLTFTFGQAMFLKDAGLRQYPSSQGTFQTWWTLTVIFSPGVQEAGLFELVKLRQPSLRPHMLSESHGPTFA